MCSAYQTREFKHTRVIITCASAIALASSHERSRVRMNYVIILFQSYLVKEWNGTSRLPWPFSNTSLRILWGESEQAWHMHLIYSS